MLYPLLFKPIFKEIIWGGTDIMSYKGIPADLRKIGESWELSHVDGNFSVVANGSLEGRTIDELISEYGSRLLGTKVVKQSGATFPLLIKFIDARDKLSIQVHPDDKLARVRHNSFGKTEMWYVVNATPDATLYSGFSQQSDADDYVRRVENDSIMDVLQQYNVKAGDVFFLPAGRVHAIGSGCFIAEIQQTSNITYRIYDYYRKDADDNGRELHTELAKDAIDYTLYDDYKTKYTPIENEATKLASCDYFTTNLLILNKIKKRDLSSLDSFVVYICLEGKALLKDDRGNVIVIQQGQTVLIPAETNNLSIEPQQDTKLLETFIE